VVGHTSSQNRIAESSKLPLEATSVQELFVGSFVKWVSMAEQPHRSLRSPCSMPSVGWSGAKLAAIGLEQGNHVLWSDESHFTIWQSDGGIWVWQVLGKP
jgi:hypothetical protein